MAKLTKTKNEPVIDTVVEEMIEDTPVVEEITFTVVADKLNVRQQPNKNAAIVEVINKGFKFTGIVEGDWVKMSAGNYVMKEFVK